MWRLVGHFNTRSHLFAHLTSLGISVCVEFSWQMESVLYKEASGNKLWICRLSNILWGRLTNITFESLPEQRSPSWAHMWKWILTEHHTFLFMFETENSTQGKTGCAERVYFLVLKIHICFWLHIYFYLYLMLFHL